jgi:hypothetical protein
MTLDAPKEDVGRTILRTVVVVGLVTFALGATLPNLLTTLSGLPFSTDAHERVTAVYGSAIPARMQVGDVIDFRACTLKERLALTGSYYFARGELVSLPVVRGATHFIASMTPVNGGASTIWLTVIKRSAATTFVITAALLLLRRPSRMLWGFFLYALGSVNADPLFYEFLPSIWYFANASALNFMYYATGPIGLWLFASRFPQDRSGGLRRLADRGALPAFVLLALADVIVTAQTAIGIVPFDLTLPVIGAQTIGLLCFVDAYVHLRSEERQRLKWVLAGMTLFYIAFAYEQIAAQLPGGGWPTTWSNAGWTVDVLSGAQIVIPITVAYAVLKHRVIDVNFVMSRALVYGLVTTLVIGIFALIDWFFTKALAERQVAAFVEIVAALGLGFSLNAVHKFVDAIVDRVLFRRRHLAEIRLARAAAGVRHVSAASAIDDTLTEEPVDALGLTSAAVFRLSASGTFAQTRAIAWEAGSAMTIDANDSLVQNLQGERGIIRLRDVRRPGLALPQGAATPAIAVPLFVRHTLDGFVLYGAHAGGEDFDPVEIGLLEQLAAAAAATYDHLDAEAAREEAERLDRELRDARRTIASLRAQPAS